MNKLIIILWIILQSLSSLAQNELLYSLFEYYPFDGNATDESGNGMDGIIYGSTTNFEEGINNLAISFHNIDPDPYAVNDYVELPNITINDFTVSHWIQFRSDASPDYEAATYSMGKMHPDTGFYINILSSGELRACIVSKFGGSSLHWITTKTYDVSDHEWYHVAVTVGDGYMILYVNGDSIDAEYLDFDPSFIDAPQFVSLHAWEEGIYRSSRFNGNMDELRIFNRVLLKDEIQLIYYGGTITLVDQPNLLNTPFFNKLAFKSIDYISLLDCWVKIFDLNGNLICDESLNSKINLNDLLPGMYLIIILDKKGSILVKNKFIRI
jgi:hypothetical protein